MTGGGHECDFCRAAAFDESYVVVPPLVRDKRVVQRSITAAVCERHRERFEAEKAESERRKAEKRSEAAKQAAVTRKRRRGLSVTEMTDEGGAP